MTAPYPVLCRPRSVAIGTDRRSGCSEEIPPRGKLSATGGRKAVRVSGASQPTWRVCGWWELRAGGEWRTWPASQWAGGREWEHSSLPWELLAGKPTWWWRRRSRGRIWRSWCRRGSRRRQTSPSAVKSVLSCQQEITEKISYPEVAVCPARRAAQHEETQSLVLGGQEEPAEEIGKHRHQHELAKHSDRGSYGSLQQWWPRLSPDPSYWINKYLNGLKHNDHIKL